MSRAALIVHRSALAAYCLLDVACLGAASPWCGARARSTGAICRRQRGRGGCVAAARSCRSCSAATITLVVVAAGLRDLRAAATTRRSGRSRSCRCSPRSADRRSPRHCRGQHRVADGAHRARSGCDRRHALDVEPPAGVPAFAIDCAVADGGARRRVRAEADRGARRHRRVHRGRMAAIVAHERGHLDARDNLKRWLMASRRTCCAGRRCITRSLTRGTTPPKTRPTMRRRAARKARRVESGGAALKIARLAPAARRDRGDASAHSSDHEASSAACAGCLNRQRATQRSAAICAAGRARSAQPCSTAVARPAS